MNATKWYPTCRRSKAPAGGCAAICAWCRPQKESWRCVYKTPYLCAPKLCRDAGNRTRILRTRSVCNTTIPHPDTVFERIRDIITKYFCGRDRTRTCDLSRVRGMLYQLSYAPLVDPTGIEPVTSSLQMRRSTK